ncbi:hypothetical protein I3842_05G154400 [Carya illinoinensis]|uniref:Uncharacterized protein n=1 Tax=Carya illinoinensis TaxID=32201 RepID=A0A922JMN3_CARIL|nr:hypothetical protein I3842_05G154400 [Carya illinoinensis]
MAGLTEVLLPYRIMEQDASSSSSHSSPTDAVSFFGLCLVLGIACRHLLRGTRVPYTLALLILGIGLGSIGICFISISNLLLSLSLSKCYFILFFLPSDLALSYHGLYSCVFFVHRNNFKELQL